MNNQDTGHGGASGPEHLSPGDEPDPNRVLVIAPSPINRIVIARTIERIYLRPLAATPDGAQRYLQEARPVLVIIDGAAHDDLPEPLLAELARRRRASRRRLPRVVLISDSGSSEAPRLAGLVDTVVVKPITPDMLQPVVERLMAGLKET